MLLNEQTVKYSTRMLQLASKTANVLQEDQEPEFPTIYSKRKSKRRRRASNTSEDWRFWGLNRGKAQHCKKFTQNNAFAAAPKPFA
jgi:hypothetical protein